MLLENMSYVEVEAYLQEKDTVLVPIGSVEQHSPYGLIGTDFITAEAVAREAGKRMYILVAPTLPYGMSQHHMAFKGSITLSPVTYINVIKEIVISFLSHGFKRIVFINGHGGNINPVKTAFDQLKYENYSGIFEIISWYQLDEVKALIEDIFGEKEGHHATPSEISITKYLRADEFKTKPQTEKTLEKVETFWPLNKYEMKKVFPDGRMESASWLANEKYGKIILEEAVRSLEKRIKKILNYKLPEE
jgi:creatinine amidohydrolase